MPAFMNLGDIRGESGDARFPGWLPLESFQLPRPPGTANASGASRGRDLSRSFQSDIVVTLRHSSASPLLQKAAAEGRTFPLVTIVTDPGGTFKFTDVIISGYSFTGGSGGGPAMEYLTLSFRDATFESQITYPATPAGPAYRLKNSRPARR